MSLGREHPPAPVEIEGVRVGLDHLLGERVRLGKEEPVPVAEAERHVGSTEVFTGWDDVQDGQRLQTVRMVERHSVRDPATSIVANDREAVEPEPAHHLDHVAGHRSLRVRLVIGGRFRLRAITVPT